MSTPRIRRYRCPWFTLLVVLSVASVAGCGSGKYPVAGKVVWPDGSPAKELFGGMVVFESTTSPVCARGDIKEDGTFRLLTERPDDGAALGRYRVLINQPRPDDDIRPRPPLHMDLRFEDFKTSGLEFTVEAKRNEAMLKVERNPAIKRKAR